MTLLELAERCEGASADEQREMLLLAFEAAMPMPRPTRIARQPDGAHWPGDGIGPYTSEFSAWSEMGRRFRKMLDALAFESAAMMLVPEGWNGFIRFSTENEAMAGIYDPADGFWGDPSQSLGKTPALALTAASLRARESTPS